MMLRALRLWGALLLAAAVALPATTAGAAGTTRTAPHPTRTSAHPAPASRAKKAPARKSTRKKGRKSRAARRPPGGVVYARNAIVVDAHTDQVLFEKRSDQQVPIASLTKLMSAMVFLDQRPDLRRQAEVTRAEIYGGGHTQLRNGERLALYDLLHMSLMNSDNVATRVLARESGLSPGEFADHMNRKAEQLGLQNTHFVEPTGLDERNVSTAVDVARLLRAAADHYLIREVTTTPTYAFTGEYTGRWGTNLRPHLIVNTNRLLRANRYEFSCTKTGFISEAGYCVASWVRDQGRDLITVVLGAPTNATRFADLVRLVQRVETLSVADPNF